MQACPSGSYCPIGTSSPIPCSAGDFPCSSETGQGRDWIPLLFLLLVPLILFLLKLIVDPLIKKDLMAPIARKGKKSFDVEDSVSGPLAVDPTSTAGVDSQSAKWWEGASQKTGPPLQTKADVVIIDSRANQPTTGARRMSSGRYSFKSAGLNLSFKKLVSTLPNGKIILQSVSGECLAGRVTAIMGPSGAGKTTTLNVLCGKMKKTSGEIFINGAEDRIENYRRVVGYVPQDDIMHRTLTVQENLYYNACLRLPSTASIAVRNQLIEDTMAVLGLLEIRHVVIGDEFKRGVSGGQRKRVNIGMELVADPEMMFLDEPTSGLDSTSAKDVVAALKDIAIEKNVAISVVLHQPRFDIFRMFDDLLLLGVGGRTVYVGQVGDVANYFDSLGYPCPPGQNPADFYMDVIAGEVPPVKNLFDLWDQTRQHDTTAHGNNREATQT